LTLNSKTKHIVPPTTSTSDVAMVFTIFYLRPKVPRDSLVLIFPCLSLSHAFLQTREDKCLHIILETRTV